MAKRWRNTRRNYRRVRKYYRRARSGGLNIVGKAKRNWKMLGITVLVGAFFAGTIGGLIAKIPGVGPVWTKNAGK